MKRSLHVILACFLVVSAASGCGTQKAESSSAAIQESKAMQTTQEKADYLIAQAKAFYNSKQFQDAVNTAQHVLRYLDSESQAAKDLLEKAKDQITAKAQGMLDEAKKGFSGFGK